jgi:hypothetical protein
MFSSINETRPDSSNSGGDMKGTQVSRSALLIFRSIFFLCALYFLLMGMMMMLAPELVTKGVGVQHPRVMGILRGIGGSILGSTVFYVLIALRPFERRWAAIVVACANVLAIVLDLVSVHLGEFTLDHAMIDIPVETLSVLTIVIFYSVHRNHTEEAS